MDRDLLKRGIVGAIVEEDEEEEDSDDEKKSAGGDSRGSRSSGGSLSSSSGSSSSSDDDCQWDSCVSAHEDSDAVPFSRMKELDSARDLLVFAADKAGMQAAHPPPPPSLPVNPPPPPSLLQITHRPLQLSAV